MRYHWTRYLTVTKTALNNSLDVKCFTWALAVSKRKHRKFVFEARVERCQSSSSYHLLES